MKVLVVTNYYPPRHLGGYEVICHNFVEHMRRRGIEARVLTSDHGAPGPPDEHDVHRELALASDRGIAGRLGGLRSTHLRGRAALRRHIAQFSPDVISWWKLTGLSNTLLTEGARDHQAVGMVCDFWLETLDAGALGGRRLLPDALADRLGLPRPVEPREVASWAFISAHLRDHTARAGLVPPDAPVVRAGVDATDFPVAERIDWSWRLLFVGRLDARKGLATAIRALADLPEEARLRVVSTDAAEEARAPYLSLARELGVAERVSFADPANAGEMPAHYAEADAVLFPVEWPEPWGLVPLEAMATGASVVATGLGGSGEYLEDRRNALIFPAGDAGALAQRVRELAGDGALRESLRAGGLETVRRYSGERFNDELLGLVREAARSRTSASSA